MPGRRTGASRADRTSRRFNGTWPETVLTATTGPVPIAVPRDLDGMFEPQIVEKRQRRLNGVDDVVLPLPRDGRRWDQCSLEETLQQRKAIGEDVERMLDAHPLCVILISMPGAQDSGTVPFSKSTADQHSNQQDALAAYAGITPVTRRAGTSIRGEHPPDQETAHSKGSHDVPRG